MNTREEGRPVVFTTDLVRRVAQQTGLRQRVVRQVLGSSLRTIEVALAAGERVTLPGFGTFSTSHRRSGRVRSIHTGRQVEVPARRVAVFRVGDVLKRAVAGKRRGPGTDLLGYHRDAVSSTGRPVGRIPYHFETTADGLRIISSVDRTCVIATEVSAMAPQIPGRLVPPPAGAHWDQISFLAEDTDANPVPTAPRPVREALGAADHADDHSIRREALERLASHLTEQAVRRGRTPVPKHALHHRARGG